MATIYYIDSENVGDSWIELINEPDSRFLVFYTGHSPRIAYPQVIQLMNAANRPEFVECFEGNNGLDFQLVSYMGYELRENNSNEMVIVSNDTGFDTVVHFWTERGMKVKRVPRSTSNNSQPVEKKEPVSDGKAVTDFPSVDVSAKICGVDCKELYTIINCIGKGNPADIHLAFVHFYGNTVGENIYKHFKKSKFVVPAVQWSKETKMQKLIELIIRYKNTANVSVPENMAIWLTGVVVADKATMGKKMTQTCGASGTQLHKMFTPFYKILAKIKKK